MKQETQINTKKFCEMLRKELMAKNKEIKELIRNINVTYNNMIYICGENDKLRNLIKDKEKTIELLIEKVIQARIKNINSESEIEKYKNEIQNLITNSINNCENNNEDNTYNNNNYLEKKLGIIPEDVKEEEEPKDEEINSEKLNVEDVSNSLKKIDDEKGPINEIKDYEDNYFNNNNPFLSGKKNNKIMEYFKNNLLA